MSGGTRLCDFAQRLSDKHYLHSPPLPPYAYILLKSKLGPSSPKVWLQKPAG